MRESYQCSASSSCLGFPQATEIRDIFTGAFGGVWGGEGGFHVFFCWNTRFFFVGKKTSSVGS